MKEIFITYYLRKTIPPTIVPPINGYWESLFNTEKYQAPITLQPLSQKPTEKYPITRTLKKNKDDTQPPAQKVTIPNIVVPDMSYYEFQIPKHSGGYRTITAPNAELKTAQNTILNTLYSINSAMHNTAFAYIQHRSCKDALAVHQQNESNWFLKIDLKNFFPSCTKAFFKKQLTKIYPLCYYTETELQPIFDLCFLYDKLPQGAPTSPYLSNLLMIPFDYEINKKLYNYNRHRFVYTRYADDLLISCKEKFNPDEIVNIITEILKDSPLKINQQKVRFGSKSGRNWNLGLMLNNKNDITVGNVRKRHLKNALYNFMRDYSSTPAKKWSKEDLYHLQGELAYIENIEPEAVKHIYETKFPNIKQYLIEIIKTQH